MSIENQFPVDFNIGGGELLAKVLPAGGPLVSTHWTCPTCGLTMRGLQPSVCMDDCNPECTIGGTP